MIPAGIQKGRVARGGAALGGWQFLRWTVFPPPRTPKLHTERRRVQNFNSLSKALYFKLLFSTHYGSWNQMIESQPGFYEGYNRTENLSMHVSLKWYYFIKLLFQLPMCVKVCESWVAMLNTVLTMICGQKSFKSIRQPRPCKPPRAKLFSIWN